MSAGRLPQRTSPITGGHGHPFGAPLDLERYGYVAEEFLFEGSAQSYRSSPGTSPGRDGDWSTVADATAPYVSRMFVLRPADAKRFSGAVIANWQNVTVAIDVGSPCAPETYDAGHVWVGVTTQKLGIGGLPGQTPGLIGWDAERYGRLSHPGDAFSYDIFAQAGRALMDRTLGQSLLHGLKPEMLLGSGSSQSAMRLCSYVNIAHRHDRLFDGYLPIVGFGVLPPVEEAPLPQMLAPASGGGFLWTSRTMDVGDAKIMAVSTETEAPTMFFSRQPDTASYRYWEVAGATHADIAMLNEQNVILEHEQVASPYAVPAGRNQVDWSNVRSAAVRSLVRWVREGAEPVRFAPIEIALDAAGHPQIKRDELGNALGGLRLPDVTVPAAVNLGSNGAAERMAAMGGVTQPFSRDKMISLYGSREGFLTKWDAAVDALAAQGLATTREAEAIRAVGRSRWDTTA
ncbi:MAG: hypothetical protein JO127_11260 [Caulobacteraceae bacterium]|nr:hypothetical protein [Caulobacteraceae bacterium]